MKVWFCWYRNSVLNIKYFNLSDYCVEQTDSNKNRAHTDNHTRVWTHHGCEFSPSESYANKCMKPQFPRVKKKVFVLWIHCWPAGAVRPDSDSWWETVVFWKIWQVAALLTSPESVTLIVRKERKQGHPTTSAPLVPHDTLQHWGRLMTHSVHRGISGIWVSNIKTDFSKACMWYVPNRSYSDLNFLILWVSQTIDFFTADNTWPSVPSASLEIT